MTENIDRNADDELLHEDLDFSTWKDYYLFVQFLFYFSQGAAFAAILLMVNFLQSIGYTPTEALTLQSVMMAPWLIKIGFGILSDTVKIGKFGRRKPYILIAGLIGIIGWVTLPMYKAPHWSIIIIGMLVTGSVALGDTVLDSLGVDITPPNRRGWMMGIAWGGRGGGAILTGIFLGLWGDNLGLQNSYIIIGIFAVVGIMSALLIKEADKIPDVKLSDFGREFKKSITWHVTLFDFISGMGIALVSIMVTFLGEVAGLDIETAGVGTIGWGLVFFSVGQLIGALSIGGLGQKLNLLWVFVINAVIYAGFIVSFLWIKFEAFEGIEFPSVSNLGQLSIGTLLIAALVKANVSYPVAMQISTIALVLSLIPGVMLIKKLKLNRKPK
jgi:MFS family permease